MSHRSEYLIGLMGMVRPPKIVGYFRPSLWIGAIVSFCFVVVVIRSPVFCFVFQLSDNNMLIFDLLDETIHIEIQLLLLLGPDC